MAEYNVQMKVYNQATAGYDGLNPNPMHHASTHATGGVDEVSPASIGAQPANTNLTEYVNSVLQTVGGTVVSVGTKIASGSYVGTGTYGSGNKNTLSFDFVPKFLMVQNAGEFVGGYQTNFIIMGQLTVGRVADTGATDVVISWTNNNKTINWYNYTEASAQLNSSGVTYTYIALG